MPAIQNIELLRGISTAFNFKPEYVTGDSAWVAHTPFAAALVSELKPKLIVELGTHSGDSYFAFCQTVKEAQLDTTCYAVDTWTGDVQAGWYGPEIYQSVATRNKALYSEFSYLLRSTFDNAVSQFSDESIDLLHIDGLHTYEACKHDYETWLPKVKKGGVILFHDICARHDDFGVWKLWEELKGAFPHAMSFSHGSGLGVLINDQKPPRNKFLADLLKPEFQNYIQMFGTFGNQIQAEYAEKKACREKAHIHAQLYIASGEEPFAEERSVRQNYSPGKIETLRFENIRKIFNGEVLKIRFDPADRHCRIQLIRVSLFSVDKHAKITRLVDFMPAGHDMRSENVIFINDARNDFISQGEDPQFYLPPVQIASQDDLIFEVELVATTEWQELAECIKRIMAELSTSRDKLKAEQEKDGRICALEKELARVPLILEENARAKEALQSRAVEQDDKVLLLEKDKKSLVEQLGQQSLAAQTLQRKIDEQQQAKDNEIETLKQQLEEEKATSNARCEELERTIALLEQQSLTMQSVQKELSETLETKETEISALRRRLQEEREGASVQREKLESEIAFFEQRLSAMQSTQKVLGERLETKNTENDLLNRQLRETQEKKIAEINALGRQVQALQTEVSQRAVELDEKEKQRQQEAALAEERVAQLNQLLDETRGNVAEMRSGILWRLAAPFRALARLLSPKARKQPRNRFHLDAPIMRIFARSGNPLNIAGWFVDTKGRPAQSVRVRTGNHQVGCESVERLDVVALFKSQGIEIPDKRVGFRGKIKTRPGLKYLVVEAENQTGGWVPIRRILLWMAEEYEDHKQARLGYRFCLDMSPKRLVAKNPFTLSGWFFDKEGHPARQIRAKIGQRIIVCEKVKRPDLPEHFRNLNSSGLFGFRQNIRTGIGFKLVILEAEMFSGEIVRLWRKLLWVRGFNEKWIEPTQDYQAWTRENEKINPPQLPLKNGPLISVLMPVYNTPEKWLRLAIESVRKQTYANWELCIADDASPAPHVRKVLEEYKAADKRIKIAYRKENGHISASSNTALEMCSGLFTVLLDHDDELVPCALAEVANAISHNPTVSVIYSDEDKIDENGIIKDPYFKSDWNYQLFLSHNMISHLGAYRTSIIKGMGGFRVGLHGSQDYDLALRVIEKIKESDIYHIPRVLYHWRILPGSTSLDAQEKPYAMLAGERALNEHFSRVGCDATSELIGFGYRTRYALKEQHKVSILIPTKNNEAYLGKCLESLLSKTTYGNYEILIVDNGSTEPATVAYLNQLRHEHSGRLKILEWNHPFNYSAINNFAVKHATGKYLCFLNDDIEIVSSDWLAEMVSIAVQQRVGAVGACLWYPDGTLQHGGIILGLGAHRCAGHAHHRMPKGHHGYFGRASLQQELCAVTAACLVVKKRIFEEIGGFNENELAIAFNDVDLCLRLRSKGYKNIWTPFAELIHHESVSRGADADGTKVKRFEKEIEYMKKKWQELLGNDPGYNPNLTLDKSDFSLAWPIRQSINNHFR